MKIFKFAYLVPQFPHTYTTQCLDKGAVYKSRRPKMGEGRLSKCIYLLYKPYEVKWALRVGVQVWLCIWYGGGARSTS